MRHTSFALAFRAMALTGANRWAALFVRGRGVIFTLHRVCAPSGDTFSPNALLEITPEFLDAALAHIRAAGIDLVSMDEACARVTASHPGRFFVALTFDDGFRDTLDVALPILRKHQAPACVYIVPGFAARTAPLWWVDLEEAVRRLGHVQGRPTVTPAQKHKAFEALYWQLRARPEADLRSAIAALCVEAGHDSRALVEKLCLDWDGIAQLADDPLITIGAHSLSHPRLAKVSAMVAADEISTSKTMLEERLGRPVAHFAYPVGDETSAAAREFSLAAAAGFTSAVTTRPGHVFGGHGSHLQALPRVSLNGHHQNMPALRAMLSGLPFWALNRGRKLNVGETGV